MDSPCPRPVSEKLQVEISRVRDSQVQSSYNICKHIRDTYVTSNA